VFVKFSLLFYSELGYLSMYLISMYYNLFCFVILFHSVATAAERPKTVEETQQDAVFMVKCFFFLHFLSVVILYFSSLLILTFRAPISRER
jgi:hypothetical protein